MLATEIFMESLEEDEKEIKDSEAREEKITNKFKESIKKLSSLI